MIRYLGRRHPVARLHACANNNYGGEHKSAAGHLPGMSGPQAGGPPARQQHGCWT